MSRLSIRFRLTLAFAVATFAVLVAAGAFVYLEQRDDLNEAVDETLESRSDTAAALLAESGRGPTRIRPEEVLSGSRAAATAGDPEEGFVQLLSPSGRLITSTGSGPTSALTPEEARRAAGEELVLERPAGGVEGRARILARPAEPGGAPAVLAVGQSLDDRDETLASLTTAFTVGGAIAVVVASLLGYVLAAAGLRPVEAMRRRAQEVSLDGDEDRLPLPPAHDEVRRLGETLNEMLDRLRRSFERERRFVADASHELRTPVAVLKTELEGAMRAARGSPELCDALASAVEECDHLAALAEDLLVLARAAEGRLPVRPEPLPVRDVLEDVRRRFEDRAAHRGRGITAIAPDELTVHADPARLRQALGNLVDNALRHGAGEVTVEASAADPGVELEVTDAGAGFGREIAGSAFERFTRGDEARTRGGSGLGMAIVHAVADVHGGSATIVPGDGGRVRLWLPDGPTASGRPRRGGRTRAEEGLTNVSG